MRPSLRTVDEQGGTRSRQRHQVRVAGDGSLVRFSCCAPRARPFNHQNGMAFGSGARECVSLGMRCWRSAHGETARVSPPRSPLFGRCSEPIECCAQFRQSIYVRADWSRATLRGLQIETSRGPDCARHAGGAMRRS
jgi:hypothetical protein